MIPDRIFLRKNPCRGHLAIGPCLFLLTLVAVNGCGGEPRLESVSGSVTLDDKPLANGTIQFGPQDGKGLAVGTLIQEGAYRLPNPPGLAPGRYRVIISAQGGSAARGDRPPDADLGRPSGKEPIPARYNDQTTLNAEVTAGGPNNFPFDLSSKPDAALAKGRAAGNAK